MILEVQSNIKTLKMELKTTHYSLAWSEKKGINLLMSWDARAHWFSREVCKIQQQEENRTTKRFLKSMSNIFLLREAYHLIWERKKTETMVTITIEVIFQNNQIWAKCFLGLSSLKCIESLHKTVNLGQLNVSSSYCCSPLQMMTLKITADAHQALKREQD